MNKTKAKRTKETVIELHGITKVYNQGKKSEVRVLKGIDLKISKGDMISIMGPSGSGKTTLLDIMGVLLEPTDGRVLIDGEETSDMNDSDRAHIRGKKLGFVFQQYNLISSSSALDNVTLALRINGKSKNQAKIRAKELLELVGLERRFTHRPGELSGGEQQRVAIARALANNPSIILADEPTGNLDTKTGEKILNLLRDLNKKQGYTVVLISHDPRITKHVHRVIKLKDGEIIKG